MSKLRYIGLRAVQTVFTLWLILTLIFVFFRLMPGSYVDLMVFQGASEASIDAFRESWGLNKPIYEQYARFIWNLLHLDAGTSIQYRRPVIDVVWQKIFNSLILVAPAITFTYVVGSLIGTKIGANPNSRLDRYGIMPIMFLGATPAFITGMVLVIVFAVWLNWFPTSGMVSHQVTYANWYGQYLTTDFLSHYVLPFTAVVLRYLYLPVTIMRTSVVEVSGQDFFNYHRLTGISDRTQTKHLLRHSSLPVITMYPISLTRAVSGLVLIEIVFNWPGIGTALVNAVFARDIPIIQFVFFLVAVFIVFGNFAVDILYGVIDPRVSVGESS